MAYDSKYKRTEADLIKFVNDLGFTLATSTVAGYTLSGYIGSKNVAIEYNKCNTHDSLNVTRQFHYWRSRKCLEAGIRVINVWEDQLNDDRIWPTLQAIIKGALGVNAEINKIYARKCKIKELDNKTYKEFCDANHTQKCRAAKIKLGLFYEDKLVQVASFDKANSRNGIKVTKDKSKFDYEWVRGCEAFNQSRVIGGVSKLFNYFKKKYNPESVLCYSDFNFFCGLGYSKCGFKLDGYTGADKFYITDEGKRINRSASKYHEYMANVATGKWILCYGSGNLRMIWRKDVEKDN